MLDANPLQLFQKIVVDEFLREMQFYLDVRAGRSNERADFTDKLLALTQDHIVELLSEIPIPGTSLLQGAVNYGIDWLNDKRKEGKYDQVQRIAYGADSEQLRILLEDVAMEAANRYQYWITAYLVEEPLEGVIPFAKACVERMLEYVLRKKLPLTLEHLLHGLMAGRSGGYMGGYRNTRLNVREDDLAQGFSAKAKRLLTIGNYTAEGALARPGLQTYDGALWVLKDKNKTAQHVAHHLQLKALTHLSDVQLEQWFDYGYTKYIHQTDPKYGHIRVPKMLWQSLYGHLPEAETHQSLTDLSPSFQKKFNQYRPLWATITVKELKSYLDTQKKDSLLNYCRKLKPFYVNIERVFFRADASLDEWDLTKLNFEGGDFSNCVFNFCRFGGSLQGTRWQHSYLRGADFTQVTSAEQADFSGAHLEFLQASKVNFSRSTLIQTKLQYADLRAANIEGASTLGAEWSHACLEGLQTVDLPHITVIKKEQTAGALKHADALLQISLVQEKQQQHIWDLRKDLLTLQSKAVEDSPTDLKPPSNFNKLEELTASLLQEQQARLALSRHCQSELLRLSQQVDMAQQVGQKNTDKIAMLQENMNLLQKQQQYFSQLLEETHTLAEKVSRNEIKVQELDAHLAQLEDHFEKRLIVVESQLDLLRLEVASAVKQFKSETLPELIAALNIQAKHVANAMDLSQLEHFYIPLAASRDRHHKLEHQDSTVLIDEFLFDPAKRKERVFLLFGEAGSGKTIFGLKLQKRLWDMAGASPGSASIIPIRIEMKRFNKESAEDCLNRTLKLDYHFSDDAIRSLKDSDHQFIFIFDGYDELAGGGVVNLYQTNRLGDWGSNSKVLISCRTGYLHEHSYRELLGPGGEENDAQIREWYLLPLDRQQISEYLYQREINHDLDGRNHEDYERCLLNIPGLAELINTPFLLKIYISAFPLLEGRTSRILRVDLYESFMTAWFKKEEQKLIDSLGSLEGDIKKAFLQFSRRLAFAMYEEQVNEVSYTVEIENPWEDDSDEDDLAKQARIALQRKNTEKWEQFFSDKDKKTVQARRGCPLHSFDGSLYSFIHQSFLEYFIADSLWEALINPSSKLMSKWGLRCFTKESKMPALVQFLAERVRDHAKKDIAQKTLYQLIQASKYSATQLCSPFEKAKILQAAANAMTVLNFGLVSFSMKAQEEPEFFRDIQVPYADLSTAELSGIDLSNANLSHTKMVGAKLTYTKLDGADLTDVDVKQFPMLRAEEPIKSVVYSMDGQWMAVASKNIIQLYRRSLFHWKPELVLHGDRKPILSVAFAPNNLEIAAGCEDNKIRIWNIEGQLLHTLIEHTDPVTSVAYSPDGSILASGGTDKVVRLWGADGKLLSDLKGHKKRVTCVDFSPKGDVLISGSKDKTICLWSVADRKLIRVLASNLGSVTSVRFSPDGLQVAASGLDKIIRFFNLDGIATTSCKGHTNVINSIVFLPNGQRLASASDDKTIRIWRVSDGSVESVLDGHTEPVMSLAYSSFDNQLVSGSKDHTIRLWGVDTTLSQQSTVYNSFAPIMDGHMAWVTSVTFSYDGRSIVSGGHDNMLRVWSLDGTQRLVLKGHTDVITSVIASPISNQFVSVSHDMTLRVWQIDKQMSVVMNTSDITASVAYAPLGNQMLLSHDEKLELFSLDGVDGGHVPQLINVHQLTSKNIHRLDSHRHEVPSPVRQTLTQNASVKKPSSTLQAAFSRARSEGKKEEAYWERSSSEGRPSNPIVDNENGQINCVVYAPSGKHLALGGSDKKVRLCGIDGQSIKIYTGHSAEVSAIAFSFDGQFLASCSFDKTVRVWDILGDTHYELKGHTDGVTSVSFAFHGRWIASGSYDTTIRIWEKTGAMKAVLTGHKEAVTSVCFSPNSDLLASGSWDKTVRLWKQPQNGAWVPMWQHNRDNRLDVKDASMLHVFGVTPLNQKLFEQLGVAACSRQFRDSESSDGRQIVTSPRSSQNGGSPPSPASSNLSEDPGPRKTIWAKEFTLFSRKTLKVVTPPNSLKGSEDIELADIHSKKADIIVMDIRKDSDRASSASISLRQVESSDDIVASAAAPEAPVAENQDLVVEIPSAERAERKRCCSIL